VDQPHPTHQTTALRGPNFRLCTLSLIPFDAELPNFAHSNPFGGEKVSGPRLT